MNKNKNFFIIFLCLGLQFKSAQTAPVSAETKNPAAAQPRSATTILNPWDIGDADELVEFEFEDADLSSFIRYIQERFELTFILDDDIQPTPKGGKNVLGTKVSFKTHKPLTKKDAWAVFLKFLDMAGLTVVPGPGAYTYLINPTANDATSPLSLAKTPLPIFIGTNPDMLPDNDTYIRYVYFVRDANQDVIRSIIDSMKSANAPALIAVPEVRGIIITDKAYNIRTMLSITNELDTVTMPETMSIIKLKRTDAKKAAALYQSLVKEDGSETLASRLLGGRKSQTLSYFSPGARVIPEPRTNTLIVLGTEEAVQKIENFIVREIDKQIEKPYSPIHIYTLKNVKARSVAEILTQAVKFQVDSDAAKAGGVRDGDKFFQPISIVPEESGNRLIITASYEDYLKLHEVLQKIDVEQPQVAMKVLIVDIDLTDVKQFGTQIRNKVPGTSGLLGDNVNFQTSGLAGVTSVVENPSSTSTDSGGGTRLLGNLVKLATGAAGTVSSTFVTLGSDCYGVWGMFRLLQSYVRTNIISNPFLVTTNNYPAQISLGETRRVTAAITIASGSNPQESFGDISANLSVNITPQISYEGFITLDIVVTDNSFNTLDQSSGNRIEKEVRTSVILANNEVLALGGIIKDTFSETESKVPILGDIPWVGWLFKNKQKSVVRSSLLILIAPEIIPTGDDKISNEVTAGVLADAHSTMTATQSHAKDIDPVHRWFFNDQVDGGDKLLSDYIQKERRYLIPNQEEVEGRKKRLSDYL